jgi:cytochrome P450
MSGLTPLTAATADDPYPFYAELSAQRPFYFDADLRSWIASSAAIVDAVLANPALRVRPVTEPVPNAIAGTAIGELFAQLVRMNDGGRHERLRSDVIGLFDSLYFSRIDAIDAPAFGSDPLHAAMFEFPSFAVATLLGVRIDDRAQFATHASALARAMAPTGTREDAIRANPAVEWLHTAFEPRFADAALRANAIGLLFQAYHATAGLIGNAIVHLAGASAPLRDSALRDRDVLAHFIAEIARYDSPVHNTRRYAAERTAVASWSVREGDAVLALLAAANCDPAGAGSTFTFGAGRHACVAAQLASAIARAAVMRLVAAGIDFTTIERVGFEPATNLRIPILKLSDPAGRRQNSVLTSKEAAH